MYETRCQSRFNARCWMLGAGALGRPRGMVWGGRKEEGSGWGTHLLKKEKRKEKKKKNLSCASNTMSIILYVSFPIQYSDFPPCTFLSPNSNPQLVKSSLTCSKTFLQPIFLLNLYISSFSIIHPKQEQYITTSTQKNTTLDHHHALVCFPASIYLKSSQ